MKIYHFINLSNGIEAFDRYGFNLDEVRFLRIQSTACEQKRWGSVLDDLSPDFLMLAALGKLILVHDCGARKTTSRAIWQGLEWVRFALDRRWFGVTYRPTGRARSMRRYFDHQYRQLSKSTLANLGYYRTFIDGFPRIQGQCELTIHDGDKSYNREVMLRAVDRARTAAATADQ